MPEAPDNYFPENIQTTLLQASNTPENHHTTTLPFNDQKQPLLDEDISNHIQFDQERNLSYLMISIFLTLNRKRNMYYMPMDFEKLTLDRLLDTGSLTSVTSEQDLNKIKLPANEAIKDTGQPPNFQSMMAIGQLEVPISTVLLDFERERELRRNYWT